MLILSYFIFTEVRLDGIHSAFVDLIIMLPEMCSQDAIETSLYNAFSFLFRICLDVHRCGSLVVPFYSLDCILRVARILVSVCTLHL